MPVINPVDGRFKFLDNNNYSVQELRFVKIINYLFFGVLIRFDFDLITSINIGVR